MIARSITPLKPDEIQAAFSKDRKYPWSVWFDGQARILFLAEHFPSFKSLHYAQQYIRLMAVRRGFRVRIRCDAIKQSMTIQALRGKDAPSKNMEKEGKTTRRSIRNSSPPTLGGEQQSGRKTRRRPASDTLPGV